METFGKSIPKKLEDAEVYSLLRLMNALTLSQVSTVGAQIDVHSLLRGQADPFSDPSALVTP